MFYISKERCTYTMYTRVHIDTLRIFVYRNCKYISLYYRKVRVSGQCEALYMIIINCIVRSLKNKYFIKLYIEKKDMFVTFKN